MIECIGLQLLIRFFVLPLRKLWLFIFLFDRHNITQIIAPGHRVNNAHIVIPQRTIEGVGKITSEHVNLLSTILRLLFFELLVLYFVSAVFYDLGFVFLRLENGEAALGSSVSPFFEFGGALLNALFDKELVL